MFRFIALAVVLVALLALPVYAQQSGLTLEGLSSRVEALTKRVEVLFAGQEYMTYRMNALETVVALSSEQVAVVVVTATPIPTITPIPSLPPPTPSFTPAPTFTPKPTNSPTTEPSATFTPVPAEARVVLIRRQALRRGPGANHAVVDMADREMEFLVLGKSLNGDWWQVSYEGRPVWISALYADDFNTENIRIAATPTPLPSPTVVDTATPVPTPTIESFAEEEWELIKTMVEKDIVGIGYHPDDYAPEQLDTWMTNFAIKMRDAVEKCNLPFIELAAIIEENGQLIDETGISEREESGARWDLALTLADHRPEDDHRSCEEYAIGRRRWIIIHYGEEE